MKKLLLGFATAFIVSHSFAQTDVNTEVNKKDSWLKAGLAVSAPVGSLSSFSSFATGVELSGQFMETRHFGLGVATGYTQFYGKNGNDGFGVIPLGAMLRYYCHREGFFAGTDIGYSFLTNTAADGGFYLKPQLGYHNYNWNLYAFYNVVVTNGDADNIQNIGVAATYNIHFK